MMKVNKDFLKRFYEEHTSLDFISIPSYWNSKSETVSQIRRINSIKKMFGRAIFELKKNTLSVLDFGCGTSGTVFYLSNFFKTHQIEFTGVDLSRSAINFNKSVTKNYGTNFTFLEGDAEIVDLKKQFDIIISSEVIEHLLNPERYINNIYRHLKDGGFVIITTPNSGNFLKRITPKAIKDNMHKDDKGFDYHISVQNFKSLKKMLENNNIEIVDYERGTLLYGGQWVDGNPLIEFVFSNLEFIVPRKWINLSWNMAVLGKKEAN